ncbi:MAG: hypothetical protein QFC55_02815, partial [Chloroflexota bacterium]|nr:hypothetical protein [Chloroflexota bacterium]
PVGEIAAGRPVGEIAVGRPVSEIAAGRPVAEVGLGAIVKARPVPLLAPRSIIEVASRTVLEIALRPLAGPRAVTARPRTTLSREWRRSAARSAAWLPFGTAAAAVAVVRARTARPVAR